MDWKHEAVEAADECAAKAREQLDRIDQTDHEIPAMVMGAVASLAAAWAQLGTLYTQLYEILPDQD